MGKKQAFLETKREEIPAFLKEICTKSFNAPGAEITFFTKKWKSKIGIKLNNEKYADRLFEFPVQKDYDKTCIDIFFFLKNLEQ